MLLTLLHFAGASTPVLSVIAWHSSSSSSLVAHCQILGVGGINCDVIITELGEIL